MKCPACGSEVRQFHDGGLLRTERPDDGREVLLREGEVVQNFYGPVNDDVTGRFTDTDDDEET